MTEQTSYQDRVASLAYDLLYGDGIATAPAEGKRWAELDIVEAWRDREVLCEQHEDVFVAGPVEVEVRRVWKGELSTFAVVTAGDEGLTLTGVKGNRYFVTGTGR